MAAVTASLVRSARSVMRNGADAIDLCSFDALLQFLFSAPDLAWLALVMALENVTFALDCMDDTLECTSQELHGEITDVSSDCPGGVGGDASAHEVNDAMLAVLGAMAHESYVQLEAYDGQALFDMVTLAAASVSNTTLYRADEYAEQWYAPTLLYGAYVGMVE